MIGILKTIAIWLYKAYLFLPNLAVGFCEAHFKGDLGTFITLGAFSLVCIIQGLILAVLFWITTGKVPSLDEGEDDWDLFGAYTGSCDGYFIAHDILDDDDDDDC